MREPDDFWSMTARPGWLRIVTEEKDIYRQNNTAPLLLQAAPTGDFTVLTRVSATPAANYQQGGLVIRSNDDDPDDTYVRLTYGYFSGVGGPGFELGNEVAGSFAPIQLAAPADTDFLLRLAKSGHHYTAAYSTDGTHWMTIGQAQNAMTVARAASTGSVTRRSRRPTWPTSSTATARA